MTFVFFLLIFLFWTVVECRLSNWRTELVKCSYLHYQVNASRVVHFCGRFPAFFCCNFEDSHVVSKCCTLEEFFTELRSVFNCLQAILFLFPWSPFSSSVHSLSPPSYWAGWSSFSLLWSPSAASTFSSSQAACWSMFTKKSSSSSSSNAGAADLVLALFFKHTAFFLSSSVHCHHSVIVNMSSSSSSNWKL